MVDRLLIALLLLPLLVHCSADEESPETVIPEETYIDLLLELNLTRDLVRTRIAFHDEDSLRREVFSHYGVDHRQFEESHAWYQQQPNRQLARLDTVTARLRELRIKINEGQSEWKECQRQQEESPEEPDGEEL